MANAKSSAPSLNVGSVPKAPRLRLLAEDTVAPEPLHWALRTSFLALVTPSAWFKPNTPARSA